MVARNPKAVAQRVAARLARTPKQITGLRFVLLRDGRKIMQYQAGEQAAWQTPETIGVEALTEAELEGVYRVLDASRQDPAQR